MKLYSKLFTVLIVGTLQFAALRSQAQDDLAKSIYNGLTGEMSLQFSSENGPIIGTAVTQKESNGTQPAFCRRTHPVVPNPTFSYACYYQRLTGAKAEKAYSTSRSAELYVQFHSVESGGILLGSTWAEKNVGTLNTAICIKTAPVVPNAVATFSCYSKVKGIGGAISGGN